MKLLFVALLLSGLAHSGTPDQTEKQKSAAAIKFILGDKIASVAIPLCQCEDIGFSCCHLPGPGLPECKYDPYCVAPAKTAIPRFVKEEKKEQEIAILRKPDSVYCCPVELGQCNPPFGPCPPPTPPPCHWYDNLWICDGGN